MTLAFPTQSHTSLDQAELTMIYQGVRLLFVVSDMPSVDGILTAVDIASDKPMRLVHPRHLKHDEPRTSRQCRRGSGAC